MNLTFLLHSQLARTNLHGHKNNVVCMRIKSDLTERNLKLLPCIAETALVVHTRLNRCFVGICRKNFSIVSVSANNYDDNYHLKRAQDNDVLSSE